MSVLSANSDHAITPVDHIDDNSGAPGRGRGVPFSAWYRFIQWLCQSVYYSRVTVLRGERQCVEESGPVLYLSLHRNGALDGFIHRSLFPRIRYLITRNLRRSRFLRLFFDGIEVVREKDALRPGESRGAANRKGLESCGAHLKGGGQLLVFPEGTSTLGHRYLPMQRGAARILLRHLEEQPGSRIAVVPLGIHYECAWSFRSRVEVVVGAPLELELDPAWSRARKMAALQERIEKALELLGAEFGSSQEQEAAERLAYTLTLATDRSYAMTLRQVASWDPGRAEALWKPFEEACRDQPLWRHQGVPLIPAKRSLTPIYALWFALLAPFVGLAALLNAPPLFVSYLAGKLGADDRNVIALWRLLIGIPATALWMIILVLTLMISGYAALLPAYLGISLVGFGAYYRVKKLAVIVHNAVRAPRIANSLRQCYRALLKTPFHS